MNYIELANAAGKHKNKVTFRQARVSGLFHFKNNNKKNESHEREIARIFMMWWF